MSGIAYYRPTEAGFEVVITLAYVGRVVPFGSSRRSAALAPVKRLRSPPRECRERSRRASRSRETATISGSL